VHVLIPILPFDAIPEMNNANGTKSSVEQAQRFDHSVLVLEKID